MSKPEFVYVTYIETTPEKLWQALTRGDSPNATGSAPRSGPTGTSVHRSRWSRTARPATPERSSKPTRHGAWPIPSSTICSRRCATSRRPQVVFELEPYGKLVKLTVTHEGFMEGSKLLGAVSNGWPAILSGLKSMLETGKVLAVSRAALGKQDFMRQ